MKKLDTTPQLFATEKVEAIVQELQTEDPDWTYRADYDPKGLSRWARIEILDEDGEHISFF